MSVHVAATCYKPDTVYADIKIEKKVGSSWVAQPTTVNPTKAYLSAGGARTFVGATPCASGDFRATARLATNKSNGVWSTAKTTTKYTHNPCAAGPSDYRDY